MKKFILGCVLMLCGIIGGTGWLIASVSTVQGGAWSTVFNVFYFRKPEAYIIVLFYVLSAAGTAIAVRELKASVK